MAIQGELQSTDLSSIFQMLALNQTTGRLRVHDQRDFLKTRCLVLDGATLGVASMAPPSSGGLQWVDQGAISIEQWQGLFARATAQGTTVAAVAAAESALTDEQLSADSRQQQLDAILEVFLWPDVVFSLEELDSIPDQAGRVFFAVDRIVMESARRQDEWARASELLADGEHILHPNPRRQAAGDAPVDLPETSVDLINGVAEFVDGVRGLDEIARATGLSRYTTGICLASMMARGELAWMALDELLITGDRLMRDGRSSDALRLFQSALRFDRRNLAIHKRLASAYENLGQIGRASAHFRFCGLLLRRRGSLREAYDLTVRAHQLVPTNFRALRSAIELLAQMDSPLDATDEALLATARQLFHFHADAANLKQALLRHLGEIRDLDIDALLALRYERVMGFARYKE